MRVKYLFALILLVSPCAAQDSGIYLTDADLGEGKLSRRVSFDGNSLWGYINGGADIYLEYGFRNITVHEVEYQGGIIRFDLYRMTDPKAAYGIFSLYTYNCTTHEGPGQFNCGNQWQLQSVKGEYYLSAILSAGSAVEAGYATRIAESILAKTNADRFDPGHPFAPGEFLNIKGRIRYGRGPLSLDNGISVNFDAIKSGTYTDVWQITEIPDFKDITVTIITFRTETERGVFQTAFASAVRTDRLEYNTMLLDDGRTILLIEGTGSEIPPGGILKWFDGTGGHKSLPIVK